MTVKLILLLAFLLVLLVLAAAPNEEMELVVGSPGSGKSVGCAVDAINYPGSVVVLDPQRDSIASLVVTHDPSPNILYDRLSDSDFPLGLAGLLRPSAHPNPSRRLQLDQLRVQTMVEIIMRRGGGDLASTPLKEEWLTAILELFLSQAARKPLKYLPFGFCPGTDEYRALVAGTTRPDLRHKFGQLEPLSPRALRSEVGSAARPVNAIFRSPVVLDRLDGGVDLGLFLPKPRARVVIERGDEVDEDAARTVLGGYSVLIAEYCETRPKPFPMVKVFYEECVSARTVGKYEVERKAPQLRKFGEVMVFITQVLPRSFDSLLTICGRKSIYRIADRDLAHQMAQIAEAGLPPTDESRTERVERLTRLIMNFQPGQRVVNDRSGTRLETVPMLVNPWPDWPGLRAAKFQEKLRWIRTRPEYRRPEPPTSGSPPSGGPGTGPSSPSSPSSPSPPSSSPPSSAAERWRRKGGRRPDGSAG